MRYIILASMTAAALAFGAAQAGAQTKVPDTSTNVTTSGSEKMNPQGDLGAGVNGILAGTQRGTDLERPQLSSGERADGRSGYAIVARCRLQKTAATRGPFLRKSYLGLGTPMGVLRWKLS
jgi:hypothetical protein